MIGLVTEGGGGEGGEGGEGKSNCKVGTRWVQQKYIKHVDRGNLYFGVGPQLLLIV